MMIKNAILLLLASCLLMGCSATIKDYKGTKPDFDLKTFFNGELEAWGMFQDRSGQVVRRFYITMTGTWEGNEGVLDEWFTYDDGEKQRRVWKLKKVADGRYIGTAGDIVGEASGELAGYALHWNYTLSLPVGDTVYDVFLDDWMYLMDENNVMNRTEVSKFGIKFGEITLFIQRKSS